MRLRGVGNPLQNAEMATEFVVVTEKGDKNLVLLLRSATRRFGKHIVLGGLAIAAASKALATLGVRTASDPPALAPRAVGDACGDGKYARMANANVALRPPGDWPDCEAWRSLSRVQIARRLRCDFKKKRPVHDDATWLGMREIYVAIVGADFATLDLDAGVPDDPDAPAPLVTAFKLPVEVRQSRGKGRGIFVLKDVKRGEVLYDFSQSAQFKTAEDFAEFLYVFVFSFFYCSYVHHGLRSLSHSRVLRPDLSCDVMIWSYVQDFGTRRPGARKDLRMVTDLDAGSFCNDGDRANGNAAWLNDEGKLFRGLNHPPHVEIVRKDGTVRQDAVRSAPLVAVKDIRKEQELYCIYGQFSVPSVKFMKW